MREILTIAGQTVAMAIIAFALVAGLTAVTLALEPGRTVLLNIVTGIAI